MTETAEGDALLIAAARRLDAVTQYAPPPVDRNMERVADWLRQGVGMSADNQAGYLAAARTLLGTDA
jgi:hypothetical protein